MVKNMILLAHIKELMEVFMRVFLVALRQMVLVHPLILMMMEIQFGNMERLLLWTESMY